MILLVNMPQSTYDVYIPITIYMQSVFINTRKCQGCVALNGLHQGR